MRRAFSVIREVFFSSCSFLIKIRFFVMAGLRPGHPRLCCLNAVKTWMPGTRAGVTSFVVKPPLSRADSGQEGVDLTRQLLGLLGEVGGRGQKKAGGVTG